MDEVEIWVNPNGVLVSIPFPELHRLATLLQAIRDDCDPLPNDAALAGDWAAVFEVAYEWDADLQQVLRDRDEELAAGAGGSGNLP